jgi:hypothetical protein
MIQFGLGTSILFPWQPAQGNKDYSGSVHGKPADDERTIPGTRSRDGGAHRLTTRDAAPQTVRRIGRWVSSTREPVRRPKTAIWMKVL